MTIYEINAENVALGRVATEVATALRGKHLPSFEPNKMPNIQVLVKNLDKVKFTGAKFDQKTYYKYSGYHSGIRARALSDEWKKAPERVLRHVVYRMLPKNKTRDKIIKNLKFAK